MADDDKSEKKSPLKRRLKPEWIWFAIPGLLVVGFFVWALMQMGKQSSGAALVQMLIGIAVVLAGGAALTWFLGRSRRTPFSEED